MGAAGGGETLGGLGEGVVGQAQVRVDGDEVLQWPHRCDPPARPADRLRHGHAGKFGEILAGCLFGGSETRRGRTKRARRRATRREEAAERRPSHPSGQAHALRRAIVGELGRRAQVTGPDDEPRRRAQAARWPSVMCTVRSQ